MKAANAKEMVGGCCVCSDERGWPENPLVYCDGQNCTVAVHQACYGIVTVPTGPWFCRKCESHERPARVRCELCPSRNGALKKTDNQGWAHVVCALYIPEVRFGNVTTMEPIILQLIPQERYAKTCYICQEIGKPARATFGACMQCNKTNCKQQFHVTCAQSLGLLCEEAGNYLDNVKYCGYCQHHYSKLKKGGNVKTIPPYKPITHDNDSSSPEKEIDAALNVTATSTSTTSIKITTNTNTSSTSISTKQRKSTTISNKSGSSSTTNNTVTATSNNNNNPSGMQGLHSTTNNNNSNSMSNNNTTNISTNNTATATGNSVGGGAGTNSTSIVRSSSSSTSSYKEKDKHSKNQNKLSSSSKDKDSTSLSISTRDSRDKSSKSSKNKDTNNTSLNATAVPTTTTSLSSNDQNSSTNTPASITGQTSNIGAFGVSTTGSNNTKDTTKISQSVVSNFSNDVQTSNAYTTSYGSVSMDSSNQSTTSSATIPTTTKSSSSNATAKKRKSDSKSNALNDDINSSFRDIIKDVSVTLTPLTDFEKEIEKSSKRQKTELSPPTHQSGNADTSNQTPSAVIIQNSSTSSTTTGATTSSTNSTTQLTNKNSLNDSKTAINLSANVTSAANTVTTTHKTGGSTTVSTTAKDHHRDERFATTSNTTLSTTTTLNQGSVNSSGANLGVSNAPSLYVSVPLSTANVPGINLPTTTGGSSTDHGLTAQSTRIASHQQQTTGGSNTHGLSVAGTNLSNSNSGTVERQSPRIQHQSPVLPEHANSYSTNTNSLPPSSFAHGVIHQSGKSPSPNIAVAGNLTATTTESGNLKISYEKQTTRVTQLQEQESAPVRRSRTPDSGIYSSSSSLQSNNNNSTSATGASLNSSTGELKFCYEAQPGSTNLSTPPTIDTNLQLTTFKESPPSSPGSEAGSVRKRGRKAKDVPISIANDEKDFRIFQNGNNATRTTSDASVPVTTSSNSVPQSAAHMLGNQINPNSSVAQRLSDQLHMEIQDHSVYTSDLVTSQYVGVPFPGKIQRMNTTAISNSSGALGLGGSSNPLSSMLSGNINGNAIPQSLDQLLERQWEQGSQFLMEQAQHFDIASLLSCLHQLQTENGRLEANLANLISRRDHLLAVNARLTIPLNSNTTQSQGATNPSVTTTIATVASTTTGTTNSVTSSIATAASLAIAATTSLSTTTNSRQSSVAASRHNANMNAQPQHHTSTLPNNMENGIDFRQMSATASSTSSTPILQQSGNATSATPLGLRQSSSVHVNYNTSSITTTANSLSSTHNPNNSNIHNNNSGQAMTTMPPITANANNRLAQQQQQQQQHHQQQQQQQQQQQSLQSHHNQQQPPHHHTTAASSSSMQQQHAQSAMHHHHQQQLSQHQHPTHCQQSSTAAHTHAVHAAHSHAHITHNAQHAQHHDVQHHSMTAGSVRVGGGISSLSGVPGRAPSKTRR